ncbi:MAG: hypothetical protein AABX82_03025, partial [Nanoarchaeota archaeon]
VEKNPDAVAAARKYAEKLGLKNILFICGDALSPDVLSKIQKADVVFCDPQRAPAEKERALATIQPNVQELFAWYGKITPNIALELPPHISGTQFDAEYEYLSVDGVLNRLTLYFGALKQVQKKLVLLPEHVHIVRSDGAAGDASLSFAQLQEHDDTSRYTHLLEPNPALTLTGMDAEAFGSCFSEQPLVQLVQGKEIVRLVVGRKIFFLSTVLCDSPFFVSHKIVERIPSKAGILDRQKTLQALQELHAEKVLLRYTIDPQQYWKERIYFEKQLKGTKTFHLFFFDVALICEKL